MSDLSQRLLTIIIFSKPIAILQHFHVDEYIVMKESSIHLFTHHCLMLKISKETNNYFKNNIKYSIPKLTIKLNHSSQLH